MYSTPRHLHLTVLHSSSLTDNNHCESSIIIHTLYADEALEADRSNEHDTGIRTTIRQSGRGTPMIVDQCSTTGRKNDRR